MSPFAALLDKAGLSFEDMSASLLAAGMETATPAHCRAVAFPETVAVPEKPTLGVLRLWAGICKATDAEEAALWNATGWPHVDATNLVALFGKRPTARVVRMGRGPLFRPPGGTP